MKTHLVDESAIATAEVSEEETLDPSAIGLNWCMVPRQRLKNAYHQQPIHY